MRRRDVKSMKVAGLREELGKRGLDTSGLKAALQERLEKALEAETLSKELEPLEEPAVAEEKAECVATIEGFTTDVRGVALAAGGQILALKPLSKR